MSEQNRDLITVDVSHRFSASPEAVFDAWLDPERIEQWMAAALAEFSPGTEFRRATVDAHVGGTFTFIDSRDEDQTSPTGTYLEIDRPRHLSFTWLPEDGEYSVVTIDIEPDGRGCLLTLRHEMESTWVDFAERTAEAWARMARQIDAVL